MGPSGRITHVIGYIGYIGSIELEDLGLGHSRVRTSPLGWFDVQFRYEIT